MASSADLVAQVDKLLSDDESVLFTMKLSKNQATWTVAGRRGRLQSKPRIIAISAKKRDAKTKVRIHIVKPGAQGLELLKSYRLASLTSIEIVSTDTTGRSFLLVFDDKSDSSQPQWASRTVDDRNHLLVYLLKVCRENLRALPRVIGIDVVDLALWAQKHAKNLVGTGAIGGEGEEEEMGGEGEHMVAQEGLVSKVEEEDMEALLGTYVIGIDEAEAFSERLKRELAGLEAANVYAILESESLVEQVLSSLDEAAGRVEDMENWLNVFNVKLKHMRDDIELIEEQNNMLEVQAVNNKALLKELEQLLQALDVSPQWMKVLNSASIDEAHLTDILDASDWLLSILAKMEPPELPAECMTMRAVREKKGELEKVKAGFVRRGTDFLRNLISNSVDAIIAAGSSQHQRTNEQRAMRRKWSGFARLIYCLKDLDPSSILLIRKTYIHSLNLLLRRQTRDFSSELRTAARVTARSAAPPFADPSSSSSAAGAMAPSQSNTEAQAAADAFAKMLATMLPVIAEEAAFFARFLAFLPIDENKAVSEEDQATLATGTEELFNGVQEDFYSLVDWAFKVDPLSCITMVGLTEAWQREQQQQQMENNPDSSGGALVTRKLLLELQTRIRQLFYKYMEEANAQIEKFDRGAKLIGVLPCIPRFASMATRMEGLVRDNCRDLVDQSYNKLVTTIFSTLERVAALDPKHADVVLLENHAAFQNSTYDLAGTIPVLRSFYQQSSDIYEASCTHYIDTVILTQFDKLLEYHQKIKSLMTTIEMEEVPFQIGFSKADMRKVVKSQLVQVDRALFSIYNKMKKHLSSAELLPSLWMKCQDSFMARYEDLEAVVARCYGNETLNPNSQELRAMFNSIAP